jgi:sugar phosphate isomerase/epimerase
MTLTVSLCYIPAVMNFKRSSRVHLYWLLMLVVAHNGFGQTPAPAQAGQRAASSPYQGLSMDQVGIFLRCTGRTDPREALEAVKSLGLSMVQISKLPDRFYTPEGAEEFHALLRQIGVRASAVVVVFDGESYKDQDAVRSTVGFLPASLAEARIDYTRKCIDFASALGVRIVTFHAGFIPGDVRDPAYQRMLDTISGIAAYAAKRGVGISLETGQESGEELLRFVNQITAARVGVNFDTANLVLYGKDDPPRALRTLLGRVTSAHLKDGMPPDNPSQLGKEVRLGEGQAQVKECLRILQEANFKGPLVIENYVWRSKGTDPLYELRTAKEFLSKTLAELAGKGS